MSTVRAEDHDLNNVQMDCKARVLENNQGIFSKMNDERKNVIISKIVKVIESEDLSSCDSSSYSFPQVDRAMGSYFGMILGDYLGAPCEFLDAKNFSSSINFSDDLDIGYKLVGEQINVFHLQPGQWTDDSSMGACIADSLIINRKIIGADIRCRFWNWWQTGYNNAFKHCKFHDPHRSVGLGGNISKSLRELDGKSFNEISDVYNSTTQDAGNGGLMRLAPVPIFFSDEPVEVAMKMSSASSETTHPGQIASRAAHFMCFFIHSAINREPAINISASDFADSVAVTYLTRYNDLRITGDKELRKLLLSSEDSDSTEFCWNWRDRDLPIEQCLSRRGDSYNGYPNSSSYFGSFCLDGLAVALNAFKFGSSLESSLKICIDHRGDCDSTGAITGQLAGAFYGFKSIPKKLVDNALQWDDSENLIRAFMLTPFYQNTILQPVDQNRQRAVRMQTSFPLLPAEEFEVVKRRLISTIKPISSVSLNKKKTWGSFTGFLKGFLTSSSSSSGPDEETIKGNEFLSAAASGDLNIFLSATKFLLEKNKDSADIFMLTDGNNRSCLQLAAGNGHLEIVDNILKLHENPPFSKNLHKLINYSTSESPESALLLSLANGYEAIAILLIKGGSSLLGTAPRSRNIVFLIARSGFLEAAKLIVMIHGPDTFLRLAKEPDAIGFDALMAAAFLSNDQMCSYLLEDLGMEVGHAAKDGTNALHVACRAIVNPSSQCLVENNVSRTVDQLMKRCSLEALVHPDGFGCSPLHIALLNGNYGAVKSILSGTKDINSLICQDNDGMHPLHTVCSAILRLMDEKKRNEDPNNLDVLSKKIECCSESLFLLIEAGYPIDCKDYGDATIFHILCYSLQLEQVQIIKHIIDILEKKKISKSDFERILTIKSENGWICLHTVLQTSGDKESVDELMSLFTSKISSEYMSSFNPILEKSNSNQLFLLRRGPHNRIPIEKRKSILNENYSIEGVCDFLKSLPHLPRIVVLCGAGISTSVGIKDFRSQNGLYANKTTSNLFSTEMIEMNPIFFYSQMKELFLPVIDKSIKPSKSHVFFRLLKDMGWLSKVYTQNIDMLEFPLLDSDDVIECHGSCRSAFCMKNNNNNNCNFSISSNEDMEMFFWKKIRDDKIPTCPKCDGIIRPSVTFFGEPLPDYFDKSLSVLSNCDLLLVMGTSLSVYPVAALPNMVDPFTVRMLFNNEPRGCFQFVEPCNVTKTNDSNINSNNNSNNNHNSNNSNNNNNNDSKSSNNYDNNNNNNDSNEIKQWTKSTYRDVFYQNSCDIAVEEFVKNLKKSEEFQILIDSICKNFETD